MLETTNTTDLGLIKDVANSLARKVRHEVEILAEMYKGQTEAAEMGGQTKTA